MPQEYLIQGETLIAIADAIRSKTGSSDTLSLEDMPSVISGNGFPALTPPALTNEGSAIDLMEGKELIDADGNIVTGTFTIDSELSTQDDLISQIQTALQNKASASEPVLQTKTVTPTTSSQNVTPDSGYDGLSKVTVNAIPNTYVKPAATKAATTYTPTTSNQTIAAGTYCSGTQTIKGDANLKAENIAEGVSIFGVTGTHSAGGSGSADIETCTLTVSADSTLNPVLAFTTYENGEISTNYAIGVPPNTVVSNNIVKNSMVHVSNASRPNILINTETIEGSFYNAFKIIGDAIIGWKPCFARNTLILLSNKTTKFIQDITYQDELLVWDFDNGCYSSAKPLWIKKAQTANYYYLCKFANGVELKLIGSDGKCHRIFDIEKGRFESATDCVGKRVMSEHGETTLLSCERMDEEVEFYNIITYKHINLYAEGVLTSCRLNNIYPIENMKFVKDNRTKKLLADYPNIDSNMFCGLRIAEQPLNNEEINAYVNRLYALTDYKCH